MYQNLKGGMPAEEREDSVHYLMVTPLPHHCNIIATSL
jgi:hypothetical protein